MEQLKVLIIKRNKVIVNNQLEVLKNKGNIEIIDISKKYFKTIVKLKNKSLKSKLESEIINVLDLIGMPRDRLGYKYIFSAILYLTKIKNFDKLNITVVYNELSQIYNKSIVSIEKAIRQAIEYTFTNGNTDEIYNLFDNMVSEDSGKVSNKKFIYELIKNII